MNTNQIPPGIKDIVMKYNLYGALIEPAPYYWKRVYKAIEEATKLPSKDSHIELGGGLMPIPNVQDSQKEEEERKFNKVGNRRYSDNQDMFGQQEWDVVYTDEKEKILTEVRPTPSVPDSQKEESEFQKWNKQLSQRGNLTPTPINPSEPEERKWSDEDMQNCWWAAWAESSDYHGQKYVGSRGLKPFSQWLFEYKQSKTSKP